jgi:hypothetical protein
MLNYSCGWFGAAAYVQLIPIHVTAADKLVSHIGPGPLGAPVLSAAYTRRMTLIGRGWE